MFPSCDNETEVRKSRVGFTPCLRARCVTDQFDMDSTAPIILNEVCYQLFRISFPIIRLRICLLDTTDIRIRRISFHVGATRAKYSCVKLTKYANDKRRVRCSKSCGKQASSVGHSSELLWNKSRRRWKLRVRHTRQLTGIDETKVSVRKVQSWWEVASKEVQSSTNATLTDNSPSETRKNAALLIPFRNRIRYLLALSPKTMFYPHSEHR